MHGYELSSWLVGYGCSQGLAGVRVARRHGAPSLSSAPSYRLGTCDARAALPHPLPLRCRLRVALALWAHLLTLGLADARGLSCGGTCGPVVRAWGALGTGVLTFFLASRFAIFANRLSSSCTSRTTGLEAHPLTPQTLRVCGCGRGCRKEAPFRYLF